MIAAAAVLGLAVFALVPGKEPSAELQALESDPMAAYAPSGGTLVDTRLRNEGIELGRSVHAELSRLYELGRGSGEPRLQHARRAAVAAGWSHLSAEFQVAGARAFRATRRLEGGRAELTVTVYVRATLLPKDVDPPALQVTLRRLG